MNKTLYVRTLLNNVRTDIPIEVTHPNGEPCDTIVTPTTGEIVAFSDDDGNLTVTGDIKTDVVTEW